MSQGVRPPNQAGAAGAAGQSGTADELVAMIPGLRIYARNLMRGGSEVDDLVQETLMKALANLNSYQSGTNLRAWLFTIMRNSFLTRVSKRAREPVGAEDCVSGQLTCPPAHDTMMAGNKVLEAIDRLPQPYREALILVFLTGESYQDVAKICGCAIGTVKSRINRARHMIMEDLGASKVEDLITSRD
ncbi:sigma-70 family RNA polymerase sigma factor [Xinfangfangia sp. CPCC 101601]|uniref:RNA polymerase sigma factor n=1 Tax=Pseudogemmobacter lacusdianii TaxID=3069608 RepID=A0ABU0VZ05_9RHOB|nr:sigma-70 family RNA polymerase sigma factor [Xinfangfangia sp. CPCC 101601]MDQ2066986.1 sigma-70 family RNA polymerase sigma factor [Xinfangfangia sp. CPCC 101601]